MIKQNKQLWLYKITKNLLRSVSILSILIYIDILNKNQQWIYLLIDSIDNLMVHLFIYKSFTRICNWSDFL